MVAKTPVKATFTGSDVTGLAEFVSGDFIDYSVGGTGLSSLGSAGQILKVNSGGTALEYGNVEAIVNIDGATDLTGSTLATTDLILASDGGTEGRVNLGQLDTLFSGTTSTLTNKTINSASNTITITESNISDLQSYILAGSTDTLTNKTINTASNTITIVEADISDLQSYILAGSTDTLTNKTIDADNNTITNIGDDELSSGISAAKIGNGDVDNTELSYLNGVTSSIQTQLDAKASTAFAIAQAVALG